MKRNVNRNLKTIVNVLRENGCIISLRGDNIFQDDDKLSGGNSRYQGANKSSDCRNSDRLNSFSGSS